MTDDPRPDRAGQSDCPACTDHPTGMCAVHRLRARLISLAPPPAGDTHPVAYRRDIPGPYAELMAALEPLLTAASQIIADAMLRPAASSDWPAADDPAVLLRRAEEHAGAISPDLTVERPDMHLRRHAEPPDPDPIPPDTRPHLQLGHVRPVTPHSLPSDRRPPCGGRDHGDSLRPPATRLYAAVAGQPLWPYCDACYTGLGELPEGSVDYRFPGAGIL